MSSARRPKKTSFPESDVTRRDFLATGGGLAAAALFSGPGGLPAIEGVAPLDEECVDTGAGWQYKRWGRKSLARISDGEIDDALQCLRAGQAHNPLDPEYDAVLALVHAAAGDTTRALAHIQRAVDGGIPFSRFTSGPREILNGVWKTPAFEALFARYGSLLVHGPMLGCVTDTEASFWVRTWGERHVEVTVYAGDGQVAGTGRVRTREAADRTGVASVAGLSPDTVYTYAVRVDEDVLTPRWSFRTLPPAGQPAVFEIGFGGCAGYTPWHERIWRTIAERSFPLFLLTGDNVYCDDPTRPLVQDFCYYRRQSRPEYRAFTASTSIAAIWDDHDFGTDDSWGGPEVDEPAWKRDVWERFRANWNNPAYGGGERRPGCWFALSIADVDVFMLDDRYYRTEPGQPGGSMLGPDQMTWLRAGLSASRATFKIIVTSVPWAYGVKPGSNDPWQGYLEERDALFDFLADERIEGVFLLSGDRHRADIWRIERENGYPLYDFENARLTNMHTHPVLPGALFGYNATCTFGRLRFDTTADDPSVVYDIITIDDEIVHSFPLSLSALQHRD